MAESENCVEPVSSGTELLKLSELLQRGWKIFEDVESSSEPLGSTSTQADVQRAVNMLQEASRMVAQLDLFSRNEELEEVATADLKYLLLPALLGALHMKLTSREKRLSNVQTARANFMDFLKRSKEYQIWKFELPKSVEQNAEPEDGSANEVKVSG